MRRAKKPKGPKKVSYELLPVAEHRSMYKLLARLIDQHHGELKDARIALAWCTSWRGDVDGKTTIGQCKKASDLDRELAPYDFVILLAKAFWQDVTITDRERRALLDHELMHATVTLDPRTHEPIEDERGRTVFRLRRHDVEEFAAVVERNGLWKHDLELLFAAGQKSKQVTLPMDQEEPPAERAH
jgi:hypothetical protein